MSGDPLVRGADELIIGIPREEALGAPAWSGLRRFADPLAGEREIARLESLGISRMMPFGYEDPFRTAFMQSVDAREGITTGISADDRAHTIRVLSDTATEPYDLTRPGHVMPLRAVAGGVLAQDFEQFVVEHHNQRVDVGFEFAHAFIGVFHAA